MADYYQVLRVARDAKPREITKAYRLLAMQHHPDRAGSDSSTSEMAALNEAYECLRDPEKRRVYDRTGGRAEEHGLDEGVLEATDIEEFAASYRGSALEREDVRAFVALRKGDVSDILDYIPLSTTADLERLLEIAAEEAGRHRKTCDRTCKTVRKTASALKKKEKRERKRFVAEHGADTSFAELVSKIKANQRRRRGVGPAILEDVQVGEAAAPAAGARRRQRKS